MSIAAPLVDLSHTPVPLSSDFSHDERRETQLLFGERVKVLKQEGEWLLVEALEQKCTGWIPAAAYTQRVPHPTHVVTAYDHLYPFGTYVEEATDRPIPQKPNREQLVADAHLFLNSPYLWGGRGWHVDCSGLINLLYRAQGIWIPRDSAPQSAYGKACTHLLPGDLIYLGNPVSHVIMKIDERRFIESPETGKRVRLLEWGKEVWEEEGFLRFFDRQKRYPQHKRTFI